MDKRFLITLIIIIFLVSSGCTYPRNKGELQKDIEDGKSIMFIQPHPDDSEIFMPGTFAFAGGDRGNKCYVVCIGSIENIPVKFNRTARIEAIHWFNKTYLSEYIILNNLFYSDENGSGSQLVRNQTFVNTIKSQLIDIIEAIKPDIIITFTPYGYYGHPEHIATSKIVTDIYNQLSYKPKVFYIINMGQDLPSAKKNYEYIKYPPTDVIILQNYSTKLGKTYWEAKLEVWEHYSSSVPDLEKLLTNNKKLQKNDQKEYFMKVDL